MAGHHQHAPLHPETNPLKAILANMLSTSSGTWAVFALGCAITFFIANAVAGLLESARAKRISSKVQTLASSIAAQARPIPVTIITGFLGAGKTVLLNRLLANPEGRRICIIENEAGAVSIDHALLKDQIEDALSSSKADVVVLKNGCMCCTATGPGGELERTLDRLLQLRDDAIKTNSSVFDHLVVELSGLADPAPIVETFLRPELAGQYALDGVVAVVDAKNIDFHLTAEGWMSRETEASTQLALADLVLLNKVDLTSREQVDKARRAVAQVNPAACITETSYCDVPTSSVLDLQSYDVGHASSTSLESMRQLSRASSKAEAAEADSSSSPRSPNGTRRQIRTSINAAAESSNGHSARAKHHTRAVTLLQPHNTALEMKPFTAWLQSVVSRHWRDLYRVKGILWVRPETASSGDEALPFVVHGVHADIQGGFDDSLARAGALGSHSSAESISNVRVESAGVTPALVLIGKGLSEHEARIREEFEALLCPLASNIKEVKASKEAARHSRDGDEDECGCGHAHGPQQHHHHHNDADHASPPASKSGSTGMSSRKRASSSRKR